MKKTLFIFCLLFTHCALFASIIEVDTYVPIENAINKLDANALVVFDVDDTLTVPKDLILRTCQRKLLASLVKKVTGKERKDPSLIEYSCIVLKQSEYMLVEPRLRTIFQKLHQKNISFIALTAMQGGRFGSIPRMAQWRKETLASLGLRFNPPKYVDPKPLNTLPPPPVIYYKGILCSDSHPKGLVLKAFIEATHLHPSSVLFVDDREDQVTSVNTEMEKLGIPVESYRYTGALRHCSTPADPLLAEFQVRTLYEQKQWLSDERAQEFLLQTAQ